MISIVVPNQHVSAVLSKGFLLKVEVKWLVVGRTPPERYSPGGTTPWLSWSVAHP
jgi:hypothetical protein